MTEKYIVHRIFDGKDEVIGSFEVKDGAIHYANKGDEMRCDIFPAGPIHPATERRLKNLLNNEHKSIYIVRG